MILAEMPSRHVLHRVGAARARARRCSRLRDAVANRPPARVLGVSAMQYARLYRQRNEAWDVEAVMVRYGS